MNVGSLVLDPTGGPKQEWALRVTSTGMMTKGSIRGSENPAEDQGSPYLRNRRSGLNPFMSDPTRETGERAGVQIGRGVGRSTQNTC